ncbi:hypothetical protein GQ54DRAFT_254126 [Martensiomyces pterosporus]|nr:hypothetical protein GQ54DRAFT_254126 [Martensiomyces pterosporus]
MSPTLLELLRRTFVSRHIAIEKNIHAHKVAAYSVFIWMVAHAATYYYKFHLTAVKSKGKITFANKLFGNRTGLTGHFLLLLFVLIYGSSVPAVRRKFHEAFYLMHHLFLPAIALMFVHGNAVSFQKYFAGPGAIYVIDRLYRFVRSRFRHPRILSVIQHPSNVIELRIEKRGMRPQVGQYIYINVPSISWLQWHPFTLTSAPEEDELTLHIWVAGDWTRKLVHYRLSGTIAYPAANPIASTAPLLSLPRIMVDGPYGAPTQQVFNYECMILIGGGIGVTPMSSVLKSLYYQLVAPESMRKARKVYFLWVCRDVQSLEWFQDLLTALDEEDIGDLLETRTYLTGQLSIDHIRNIALYHDPEGPDAVTGLYRSPTYYGRPNFNRIFSDIGMRNPNTNIGVFFCGPKPMGRTLRKLTRRWSKNLSSTNTKFDFHKESF